MKIQNEFAHDASVGGHRAQERIKAIVSFGPLIFWRILSEKILWNQPCEALASLSCCAVVTVPWLVPSMLLGMQHGVVL